MAEFITAEIAIEFDQGKIRASLKRTETLFRKSINRMKKTTATLTKAFKNAFTKMANFAKTGAKLIVASIALISIASIKLASDAVETQDKFNRIFGSMSDSANEFAKEFSRSLGRTLPEVQDALASFQGLSSSMDIGAREALEFSKSLTKLAFDFASVNNISDQESINKFISGMSGSSEVFQKFGIDVKETAIKLELLAMGITRTGNEITETDKKMARFSIILKTMTKQGAVGNALETAGEFAGQLKRLWSNIKDVGVIIGTALLPTITKIITAINEWKSANEGLLENFGKTLKEIVERFADFIKLLKTDPGQFFSKLKATAVNFSIFLGETLLIQLTPVFEKLGMIMSDIIGESIGESLPRAFIKETTESLTKELNRIKQTSSFSSFEFVRQFPRSATFSSEGSGFLGDPGQFSSEGRRKIAIKFLEEEIDLLMRKELFEQNSIFLTGEKNKGLSTTAQKQDAANKKLFSTFEQRVPTAVKLDPLASAKLGLQIQRDKARLAKTEEDNRIKRLNFSRVKEAESSKEALKESIAKKQLDIEILTNRGSSEQELFVLQSKLIRERISLKISEGKIDEDLLNKLGASRIIALEISIEKIEVLKAQKILDDQAAKAAEKARIIESQRLELAQARATISRDIFAITGLFGEGQEKLISDQAKGFRDLGIPEKTIQSWKNLQIVTAKYGTIIDGLKSNGEEFFLSFIDGTKSLSDAWKDMLGNMLQTMNRFLAQEATNKLLFQVIAPILGNLFAGGPGPGTVGTQGPTGMGFAHGGIANSPSIFGESGPEAAIPLPDGRTVPVTLSGTQGSNVVVNVINNSSQPVQAEQGTSFFSAGQLVTEVILTDAQFGGPITESIRNVSNSGA